MGVQVTLKQVISGLRQSLNSIDIRAAVKKSESGWQRVLTGIRISARPVEAIKRRHVELEERFGKRQSNLFRILLQALPFTELEGVLRELAQGRITVEGQLISLSKKLLFQDLQGRVERHHGLVRPWDNEFWPSICCSSGDRSVVYDQADVVAEIRGNLGLSSVEELVYSFLELTSESYRHLDLFIHIEMPAKIKAVRVVGQSVEVHVAAEKNLGPLHFFLSRKDFRGTTLLGHRELTLERVDKETSYALLRAEGRLGPMSEDDLLSCVLTHPALPELDEERGRLRDYMPTVDRSPLLECLRQFWDMQRLYQEVERPYETRRSKRQEEPQDAFQKSVARLLTLAGFQAIDLERDDRIRHPVTGVDRATIDILAYNQGRKILLLGACTVSPAKSEDLEKLLHTREILGRKFSRESPVKMTPVLFSGQENVSPFKGDAAAQGLRILNVSEMAILRRLVEKGEEERFLQFLESPLDTELRERSELEAR